MFSVLKKIVHPFYYRIFSHRRPPQRYLRLFEVIDEIHPKTLFEIGVWNGDRAIQMIKRAQRYNSEVQYYGSDLFEEMNTEMMRSELSKFPPAYDSVKKRLEKTGAKIDLIRGNTLESLPRIVGNLPPMDFIYIDGGHAVETIANDWKYASQLMHKDTVVIFDDYYPDRDEIGAKSVIADIDRNLYDVQILKTEDVFKKEDGVLRIRFVEVRKK